MANGVREKVLETFVAELAGSDSVTPKMVQDLRTLFECGDKVSADGVIAILSSSSEEIDEEAK